MEVRAHQDSFKSIDWSPSLTAEEMQINLLHSHLMDVTKASQPLQKMIRVIVKELILRSLRQECEDLPLIKSPSLFAILVGPQSLLQAHEQTHQLIKRQRSASASVIGQSWSIAAPQLGSKLLLIIVELFHVQVNAKQPSDADYSHSSASKERIKTHHHVLFRLKTKE